MEKITIEIPPDIVERLKQFAESAQMDWLEVASLWLALTVREKTNGRYPQATPD